MSTFSGTDHSDIPVSDTTYDIESLFPNRFYYFRVRAYRQTEAGTDYGAFSATIANIRYVQAKPKKRKHPLWLYLFE